MSGKRYSIILVMTLAAIQFGSPSLQAAPLFEENWDSGVIDPGVWQYSTFATRDEGGLTHIVEVTTGDWAIWSIGSFPEDKLEWSNRLYSIAKYDRGNNIRCTFRMWGDVVSLTPYGQTFSDAASCNGPWHYDPTAEPTETSILNFPTHTNIEAGQDLWNGAPLCFEQETWNEGPRMSEQFRVAWNALDSKENSMLMRVWLGDDKGAFIEWSIDDGATWFQEDSTLNPGRTHQSVGFSELTEDTRGLDLQPLNRNGEAKPTGARNALNLGWSSVRAGVFLDDIMLEDDFNVQEPPPNRAKHWWMIE